MPESKQKFDALSQDYDRYRPRYPVALLRQVAAAVAGRERPYLVDAGAGTGIALDGLVPLLTRPYRIEAVDVSPGMIEVGRRKLPEVTWSVGPAEPFLETRSGVDLVLAAQSLQWMDRPRFLRAARACLNPGGGVAILQNNRDFKASPFLDAYETLLEDQSPGYSRHYRDFDFAAELREVFDRDGDAVTVSVSDWSNTMTATDFVGMSRSSTQVQRAIDAHGDGFLRRLEALVGEHQRDGSVELPYHSELFLARAAER